MRFPHSALIAVIFMLSTIVCVTDCCSSRILLSKEHTLLPVVQEQQRLERVFIDDFYAIGNATSEDSNTSEPTEFYDWNAPDAMLLDTSDTSSEPSSSIVELPSTTEESQRFADVFETLVHQPTPASKMLPISTTTTRQMAAENHTIAEENLKKKPCENEDFKSMFCMNGGTCYEMLVKKNLYFCTCSDGFEGERCEFKNGRYGMHPTTYGPVTKPTIAMARVFFSYPMLLAISVIYILCGAIIVFRSSPKQEFLERRKTRVTSMIVTYA